MNNITNINFTSFNITLVIDNFLNFIFIFNFIRYLIKIGFTWKFFSPFSPLFTLFTTCLCFFSRFTILVWILFDIISFVKLGNILWRLTTRNCLLFLNPISSLFQHLIPYIVALNVFNLILQFLFSFVIHYHIVFLLLFSLAGYLLRSLDRSILDFLLSFLPSFHT